MKALLEKIKITFDFSKEKIKQYLTVIVILIFIFSTLSLIASTTQTKTQNYIEAIAQAKAKISSYDLELTVLEANNKTLELIEELKKEKKLTQVIKFDKEIILSLRDREEVYQISNRIMESGAIVETHADIELYDIKLKLPNGEIITIENQKSKQKLSPIFEVEETFEVEFLALYLNSSSAKEKELNIGNLIIKQPPTQQKVLEVKPLDIEQISKKIILIFPWSERKNLEEFLLSYPINFNYTKKIINYIYIKNLTTQDMLKKLAQEKPEYIIAIRDNGVEIKKEFLDDQKIIRFFGERNIEVEIPLPRLEFENIEQQEIKNILDKYEELYNSTAKIEIINKVRINKMEIVDENNTKYQLKRINGLLVETNLEPQNIKKIIINAQVYKDSNDIIGYDIERIE
ncbi:MAG: hypothetical protein QXF48_00220 [Candidatus Anstonellaceae archaeon]